MFDDANSDQVSPPLRKHTSSEHRGTKKPALSLYLQLAFRLQGGRARRDKQKCRRPGFVWECQALNRASLYRSMPLPPTECHLRHLLRVSAQGLEAFDLQWTWEKRRGEVHWVCHKIYFWGLNFLFSLSPPPLPPHTAIRGPSFGKRTCCMHGTGPGAVLTGP